MTTTTNNTRVKVPKKTLPSTETIFKENNEGSTPNPKLRVDPEKRVCAMGQTIKIQTRNYHLNYECYNNQRRS